MKEITAQEMLDMVRSQLAIDLNCAASDLNGKKDAIVLVEARQNPGRRPFPRKPEHFEMLSMGKSIVVSATPALLETVRPLLLDMDRDSAFSMPFVRGHALQYLPDLSVIHPLPPPDGYEYAVAEAKDMPGLYQSPGFENALNYDMDHPRPDVLAIIARRNGKIVGMSGASEDCPNMWQIGIDVLPEDRGHGLAAYLVNYLTLEILRREKVPYYATSSCNLGSQRVAHRAGYSVAWVSAYQGRFAGHDVSPTS